MRKNLFLISLSCLLISSLVSKADNEIEGGSKIDSKTSHHPSTYFSYGAEHLPLTQRYYGIPVIYNPNVESWINYFTGRGKELFVRYAQRAGKYARLMGDILHQKEMPRDLIFLAMAESGFHNRAKSTALAKGPWQFMPYTGKLWGLKINFYIDERYDYIKSTIAAANFLQDLYLKFGSWELAMSAYNAGEGKISRAQKMYNTKSFWEMVKSGKYLKSETKNYVPKIFALAIIGKNLKSFGFNGISFDDPVNFDMVTVPGGSDLFLISEALDVSFDLIHELNPELLRWMTPPDVNGYSLRLPEGMGKRWEECCKDRSFMATAFQTYRAEREMGIYEMARRYKIKPSVLAEINGVSENKRLKKGEELKLPFRVGQTLNDPMYQDLFELPRKGMARQRDYRSRIKIAESSGQQITNPTEYYIVKKGETLWDISKKTGVALNTLIKSNYHLVNGRMIREGDKLIIR